MELNTHLKIDTSLSGKVIELTEQRSVVKLQTSELMAADDAGLVHGGFVFSAADFAAMAVVNEPHVVLAKSNVKFTAPVKVGQSVMLEAVIQQNSNNRQKVEVTGRVDELKVFSGEFFTAVLPKHVLEP